MGSAYGAAKTKTKRSAGMRQATQWRWRLDEVYVRRLTSRETYKANRSAALSEWRSVTA